MAKQTRDEKLADIAFIRNYVINVLVTVLAVNQGKSVEKMMASLEDQEAKMLSILDKR